MTRQTFHKRLANTCRYTEIFLEEKLSKCEQRAAETLINNLFDKESVFLLFERTICVK